MKLQIIFAMAVAVFASAATAQDTNILRTQIGQFENRTGSVMIKGYSVIGSVFSSGAEISVRCKETTDMSIGRTVYGLAIEIKGNNVAIETIYLDENEIDALLSGLNYIVKITYDVTALEGFEASYASKGGFAAIAHSIRKEGTVNFYVQGNYSPRIPMSSVQMSQLYGLITQARKTLNSIKPK